MGLPLQPEEKLEGHVAAAMVALGVGVLALGLITPLGMGLIGWGLLPQAMVRPLLTALAFGGWLSTWAALARRWGGKQFPARPVVLWMALLVAAGLLLGAPVWVWFVGRGPLP